MEAFAMIKSRERSVHIVINTLIQKYGVNVESDPTLAAEFNNILNPFPTSSFDAPLDFPESNNPQLCVQSYPNFSKKYGVNVESDPSLAANYKLPIFPFPVPLDFPESSSGSNKRQRSRNNEIIRILQTTTETIDDVISKKYGSKSIKGSAYKRDYYGCPNGNCKAKIQVHQKDPMLFETTYLNRHTCQAADTYGSTSVIQFDSQLPSVTDSDLHSNCIKDEDHASLLDSVLPHENGPCFNYNMFDDDAGSSLNSSVFSNLMNDDHDHHAKP